MKNQTSNIFILKITKFYAQFSRYTFKKIQGDDVVMESIELSNILSANFFKVLRSLIGSRSILATSFVKVILNKSM